LRIFDLIRPSINPLIIDSRLIDRVLIQLYPTSTSAGRCS
jgi:hypothetical protein